MSKLIVITAFLFLSVNTSFSQKIKTVLPVPEVLVHPFDYYRSDSPNDNVDPGTHYNKVHKKSKNKTAWIVISDRSGNISRTEAGERNKLNFGDWFYVAEEKGDQIHIIKADILNLKISGKYQDFGWIEKNKMLLWTNALVDPKTRIDRKAFLLNSEKSLEEILRSNDAEKLLISAFNHPDLAVNHKLKDLKIYNFFFIYKYDPYKGAYLVGQNSRLPLNADKVEDLVGWVRDTRVVRWNTRIALEPNYEPNAEKERRSKNKTIKAFSKIIDASAYASGNGYKSSNLLWDYDPVKIGTKHLLLDKFSQGYRLKGSVIRLPLLSNDPPIYRSGVFAKITISGAGKVLTEMGAIEYTNTREIAIKQAETLGNFNILFLIDATNTTMQRFIDELKTEIIPNMKVKFSEDIDGQLKIGAAVYQDTKYGEEWFKVKELTTKYSEVVDYLEMQEARNVSGDDAYEALYYGLDNSLLKAGFGKDETNVIIVIGETGDVRNHFSRIINPDRAYYDDNQKKALITQLSNQGIHLYGIQCKNQSGEAYSSFNSDMRNLILESAKESFYKYKNLTLYTGVNFTQPNMVMDQTINSWSLKNGVTKGGVFELAKNQALQTQAFRKHVFNIIEESLNFSRDFRQKIREIFDDGDAYTMGPFAAAIALILKNYSPSEIKKLVKDKYQLYVNGYVPSTIKGLDSELYSYILFMPEYDLRNLDQQLQKLSATINYPIDKQREELYNTWIELLRVYIGDLPIGELNNMSLEEIQDRMQGIFKEGIKLRPKKKLAKVKLKDIKSNKISDEEIVDYVKRLKKNQEIIESILKGGYDFVYTSNGQRYYWIPVAYLP